MSEDVTLPALGESVTEGTVTRWLKQVGEEVAVDEALLEVSTDKVDTEIPSPVAGVLEEILAEEDETVEVGAVLARIGDGSGAAGESSDNSAADEAAEEQPAETVEDASGSDEEDTPAEDAPSKADAKQSGGEATDVTLPALGESVTEGTVTRWLKEVGEQVEADEALLEVSTDKVDTEIPSPVSGTLLEIVAGEDETVEVGAVLARIGDEGAAPSSGSASDDTESASDDEVAEAAVQAKEDAESLEAEQSQGAQAPKGSDEDPEKREAPANKKADSASSGPRKPVRPTEPQTPSDPKASQTEQAKAPATDASKGDSADAPKDAAAYVTPIVRKLAKDKGVDLSTVTGSGVGGRIRKEDVIAAAEAATSKQSSSDASYAAPARKAKPIEVSELRGTRQKMSRLRKVVAERAVASLSESAQLTTIVEADVTRIAALRDRVKGEFLDKTGNKLSFLPFFTLAAAEALQTYPIVNATVEGDEIVYPDTENVSIAVDTERGLLTPVVKDAGSMNIAELSDAIADLAERTRDNKLKPDELAGGTFTVTNTGSRGALFDTPLVFLPQSAILGTGIVQKRPVVVKDAEGIESISIRSMVYLALSYDHRIIDGADAARYLSLVKERLEEGAFEENLGL